MKNPIVVILKPDVAGKLPVLDFVMNCFEWQGLILEDHRLIQADRDLILAHYNKDEAWLIKNGQRIYDRYARDGIENLKTSLEYGQQIMDKIIDYMTSGPVIAILYSATHNNLYEQARELVGGTEPISASPGSLRHTLSRDSYELADLENRALHNAIHCSETKIEATRECALWFPDYAN